MKQTRQVAVWLVVFFLVSWVNIDAGQAATQLDASFGDNGFIVKDFGSGEDEIFAVAPQPDGKIVVVGEYDNGAVKNIAVARYLPTGELDRDFNDDGIFTHSIGSGDTRARSVAIQSDGRIVVAGSADNGANNIILVRLTAEGFLDSSFAGGGQWLLPVTDGAANAYAVQVADEGTILVAGTVIRDGEAGTYGLVAKVTTDGQQDAGFGEAGVALVRYEYDAEIRSLVLQDDGKIVVAGSFTPNDVAQAGVLRFNQDGRIDSQFGQNGRALLTLTGDGSIIHDVAIDADGRLYVVGQVDGDFPETFVAGFSREGQLDTSFAAAGIYRSTLTAENVGQAITLDEAGNLLIAGFAMTDKGKDVFLLTIEGPGDADDAAAADAAVSGETTSNSVFSGNSGADDTTDNESGISIDYLTADLANTTDVGNALAVMPGGIVFVAGATGRDDTRDFALLRFKAAEGTSAVPGTVSDGEGVSTAGYTLVTRRITNITRVGAMSGGTITDFGTQQCADACTATCSTNADPATCFTTCIATCQLPTVTQRGVVFGIVSKPVFKTDTDTDTDTDTGTDTDTDTDTGTDTDTSTDTNTDLSGFVAQATDDEVSTFPDSETFAFDIVESGQTDDGGGTGSYGSLIQGITPNTVYFVRAYALLSNGNVIYGNEHAFRTDDACFIATAAFGSILNNHVGVLREFRDKVLMTGRLGQRLVGAYYQLSPEVADLIEKYEVLRSIVRVILIPFVFMAYFILKTGLIVKVSVLTALVGLWPLKSKFL